MTSRSRTPLIVVALVLIAVAVAAIVAVLAAGDGDDSPGSDDAVSTDGSGDGATGTNPASPTTTPLPENLVGEVRPVVIDGAALPPLDDPSNDTAVGLAAPLITGENFDGETVTTASEGGPVLIVFFAHWCPHCNNEIPRLIDLDEAARLPADLRVVGVSTGVSNTRPNFPPSKWIEGLGWPWPVIADGIDFDAGYFVGANAFGVNAFPFTVVVGADGTVLARWAGASEPEDFMTKLGAALGTA